MVELEFDDQLIEGLLDLSFEIGVQIVRDEEQCSPTASKGVLEKLECDWKWFESAVLVEGLEIRVDGIFEF